MENTHRKTFPRTFLRAAFFMICYVAALINFLLLATDMIHGNHAGEKAFPKPYFGFTRIYDRPNTIEHHAVDKLAIDYAQVYFPSQEFSALTNNYEDGYLDPLHRPSRYPPFVHYMCAISFCKLDYGYASFAHILTQIILFYFFFILTFKLLQISEHLASGLFLSTAFLFLTPAGLGWFERGQFSLYVCLAYLLLILGILAKKDLFIIASAFFAYVKWTSLPFLFIIMVLFLLSSKNREEFIKNARPALIYVLVMLFLSLAFRSRFLHFLDGLLLQETHEEPSGISLTLLLPLWIVKGIPILCILWGYLCLRKNNMNFERLIPFLAAAGILLLTYPTVAFEYNIPSLLCFIPLIFHWAKESGGRSIWVKYGLFLFIFLISYPSYMNDLFRAENVPWFYLLISCVLAVVPLIFVNAFPKQGKLAN